MKRARRPDKPVSQSRRPDTPAAPSRRPDTPFWADRSGVERERLRLDSDESHHLLHVLRADIGAPFQAIDGEGSLYECVLELVERRTAVGRIVERKVGVGELPHPIHLLVGLPDWGAVEQVTSLAVPLGVSTLDFVRCERSVGRAIGAGRLGRLERIARAGLKQSRRTRLPEVLFSGSLEEALRRAPRGMRLTADPDGNSWNRAVHGGLEVTVVLAVGPPGAFTEEERRRLLRDGFIPISLGPNRLSTETAAMSFLSLARNSLL